MTVDPPRAPATPAAPAAPAAPATPAAPETPAAPVIDIRSLWHRYQDGTWALREVTLDVAPGERVGLVGPNGAGKSTLLAYAAAALLSDRVRIGGEPVTRASAPRARGRVGLVFQNPEDQLFLPSVGEDVAFGPLNLALPAEEVDTRVAEALAAVGLGESFEGRRPHELSGGEKRLVALATVLALRPGVLALDEPTNDLDPRARKKLLAVLEGLDTALLLATHDLELVLALCPRVVLLDAGRVVADGPTRDLLGDAALMEAHGLEVPLSIRLGR